MSEQTKQAHPQAYYATHDQLYAWYERLLKAAIETATTGDIRAVSAALIYIDPNNWVATETRGSSYHEVQAGETLSSIAAHYGHGDASGVELLYRINRQFFLYAPHKLVLGERLLLPSDWHEAPTNVVHLNKSNFDE